MATIAEKSRTKEVIDRLQSILNNAPSVPLASGKVTIYKDEVQSLLDELAMQIETELKTYHEVNDRRGKIINEAKKEAEKIIYQAEHSASRMRVSKRATSVAPLDYNTLNEEEITSLGNADEIYAASLIYTDEMLTEVSKLIEDAYHNIRSDYEIVMQVMEEKMNTIMSNKEELMSGLQEMESEDRSQQILEIGQLLSNELYNERMKQRMASDEYEDGSVQLTLDLQVEQAEENARAAQAVAQQTAEALQQMTAERNALMETVMQMEREQLMTKQAEQKNDYNAKNASEIAEAVAEKEAELAKITKAVAEKEAELAKVSENVAGKVAETVTAAKPAAPVFVKMEGTKVTPAKEDVEYEIEYVTEDELEEGEEYEIEYVDEDDEEYRTEALDETDAGYETAALDEADAGHETEALDETDAGHETRFVDEDGVEYEIEYVTEDELEEGEEYEIEYVDEEEDLPPAVGTKTEDSHEDTATQNLDAKEVKAAVKELDHLKQEGEETPVISHFRHSEKIASAPSEQIARMAKAVTTEKKYSGLIGRAVANREKEEAAVTVEETDSIVMKNTAQTMEQKEPEVEKKEKKQDKKAVSEKNTDKKPEKNVKESEQKKVSEEKKDTYKKDKKEQDEDIKTDANGNQYVQATMKFDDDFEIMEF